MNMQYASYSLMHNVRSLFRLFNHQHLEQLCKISKSLAADENEM